MPNAFASVTVNGDQYRIGSEEKWNAVKSQLDNIGIVGHGWLTISWDEGGETVILINQSTRLTYIVK